MIEKLKELIDLKTFVTVVVTIVFARMAWIGEIEPEQFLQILTMIYMFYFTKQPKKGE